MCSSSVLGTYAGKAPLSSPDKHAGIGASYLKTSNNEVMSPLPQNLEPEEKLILEELNLAKPVHVELRFLNGTLPFQHRRQSFFWALIL